MRYCPGTEGSGCSAGTSPLLGGDTRKLAPFADKEFPVEIQAE
jgi:hypothetical protein